MTAPAAGAAAQTKTRNYVVVYKQGVTLAKAKRAVRAIGGRVVSAQPAVRAMLVRSSRTRFRSTAFRSRFLKGAVLNQAIGRTTPRAKAAGAKPDPVENEGRAYGGGDGGVTVREPSSGLTEPLAGWQWDMRMIGATPDGSYATELGSRDVIVAVIDTGIDASHPDIAPNFNKGLSRNWTTDIPSIDGPCEERSCVDPNDVDQDGHGTHVAGTIASPINGLGMAGVAPNVTLVNDRAGQDSGFFFLDETVRALVYAGQIGADVANMSFYTDPWQYNCPGSHPAVSPDTGAPTDSPEQQQEQEFILELVQNAVDYAVAHGVTLVAAAGNDHNSLDGSKTDTTSPDYPEGNETVRVVSDWCRDMPTEADGVISVSSVGPSGAKADYSNYGAGTETGGAGDDPAGEIDVAAPGGYFRDFFGTSEYRLPQNEILGPYPLNVARKAHDVDGSGKPTSEFVVRDCSAEKTNSEAGPSPQPKSLTDCGYYQLIQGTSMASPHAAGVAALIVSKFGTPDLVHGGLTMDPAAVRERLRATATDHACPDPATVDYTIVGRDASWNATCAGTPDYNGFYGDGVVNAQAAVGG
ncbi:MAG TPA: S8 family serine peptidase [Thermoleophilaceae bacterium]|nr:S8 family serine peptidase [Thermoleophilaceae bacterium]